MSSVQPSFETLAIGHPSTDPLWCFLPVGFLLTVFIESPFLWMFLPKLTFMQRVWNGIWLTACTYPIVVLVLPVLTLGYSRGVYLMVAETFAPVAECLIFWLATRDRFPFTQRDWMISFTVIVSANLVSFAIGECCL